MVYSYDASDFGWKPGEWPDTFTDMGKTFVKSHVLYDWNEDFNGWVYVSEDGKTDYHIYND